MYQEAKTVLEVGGIKQSKGVHKLISLNDIYEEDFIKSENKDVSGYVFGECKNNHRSKDDIKYFSYLIYDIDKADTEIYDELVIAIEDANIYAVLHTSHSHDPKNNSFKYWNGRI